jgi:hypothetical protein
MFNKKKGRVAIVCTGEKTRWIRSGKLIAGFLVLWLPASVFAKNPTAADCDSTLVAIGETQQLSFGGFLGGTGGTVTVDYKGAISSTGPVLLSTPIPQPGILTFSTDPPPGAGFDCSNVTPASVSFTDGYLSNGTDTMQVTNFTYSTKSGNPFSKFNTGAYYIGADLIVNGTESSGSYSTQNAGGTPYQITISFQ